MSEASYDEKKSVEESNIPQRSLRLKTLKLR